VGVADHRSYAGKRGDFFWGTLRITAGDNDLSFGIFSVNATDRSPGVLVGGGGYGACVKYHDAGGIRLGGAIQSALLKLALYGGAVRLGRAAAEIFDVKSCHVCILACRGGACLVCGLAVWVDTPVRRF